MTLQSSGAISLDDIHVEAGGSTGSQATINDADIRALISKSAGAQMAFNEWYGASAYTQTSHTGLASYVAPSTNQYGTTTQERRIVGDDSQGVGQQTNNLFIYFYGFSFEHLADFSPFTLNSRSTEVQELKSQNTMSTIRFSMVDVTGGNNRSSGNGHPQNVNDVFTSIKIKNNSSNAEVTLNRSAASYQNTVQTVLGRVASGNGYSVSRWTWTGVTNVMPTSHNNVTVTITLQ